MLNRKFAERLNLELDNMDVPPETAERIDVLSKLLKVPKFKAETLLSGLTTPDETLLNTLTDVLEVKADWLLGKSDAKN